MRCAHGVRGRAVGQIDWVDNRATIVFWVSPACYEAGAVVSGEGKLDGGHYFVGIVVVSVMVVMVMIVVIVVVVADIVATGSKECH